MGWLSIFKMTDTFIDSLNIDYRADSLKIENLANFDGQTKVRVGIACEM